MANINVPERSTLRKSKPQIQKRKQRILTELQELSNSFMREKNQIDFLYEMMDILLHVKHLLAASSSMFRLTNTKSQLILKKKLQIQMPCPLFLFF
jgi:hypothetical protein